jgi:hypothetical protein
LIGTLDAPQYATTHDLGIVHLLTSEAYDQVAEVGDGQRRCEFLKYSVIEPKVIE